MLLNECNYGTGSCVELKSFYGNIITLSRTSVALLLSFVHIPSTYLRFSAMRSRSSTDSAIIWGALFLGASITTTNYYGHISRLIVRRKVEDGVEETQLSGFYLRNNRFVEERVWIKKYG